MKSIWYASGILLVIGIAVCLVSFAPVNKLVPYTREVQHPVNEVQQDGTVKSLLTFYSHGFTLSAGDKVKIKAQAQDCSLEVEVKDIMGNNVEQQSDVVSPNLEVSIPSYGWYGVYITRYRSSPYVIFLDKASAYVHVETESTQTSFVQDYQSLTTYPYRDLWMLGVAVMICGIGTAVVLIARKAVT